MQAGDCVVAAVAAGPEQLGALVLSGVPELAGADQRILERAALVTALLLLFRRSAADAEERVRGELLGDLLAAPRRDPDGLRERARRLGVDLDTPHTVVVVDAGELPRQRVASFATMLAAERKGLAGSHSGRVLLMLPQPDPAVAARAVAQALEHGLGGPVTAGAGGPGRGPEGVATAHAEAEHCLEAMLALGRRGTGGAMSDLGFLGLVLGESRDAGGFVRRTLGPLLDYDARRGTELLATLEQYFAHGGSLARTREVLHVHVNTVAQRLERIGRLLGEDWNTPGPRPGGPARPQAAPRHPPPLTRPLPRPPILRKRGDTPYRALITSRSAGSSRLQAGGGGAVPGQHVVEAGVDRGAVEDDRLAGDHGVPGRGRPAAQPGLDRVGQRPRVRDAGQRPDREVGAGADGQLADLAGAAEAAGAAAGGDLQRVPGRRRAAARAAACPAASRSAPPATATPSPRTPSRRSPARPARRPPAAPAPAPARRRGSGCCSGSAPPRCPSRRAGRPRPGSAGCSAPPRTGRCPSRPPRSARPAAARRWPGRSRPRPRSSARWVCSRTSSRSASSAVARISSAVTENGEHGASAIRTIAVREPVVVPADQPLGVGQDLVLVLHHRVRRQPAVLDRQRHRAAGRVEAHAQLGGGGDLGRDEVAGPARVHVQVVGGGGAAAEGQLGQPDVRGDVRGLLVQPGPQWIERGQPVEQAAAPARARTPG